MTPTYVCNTCFKSMQVDDRLLVSMQPSLCTLTMFCKGQMVKSKKLSITEAIPDFARTVRLIDHEQTVPEYKWTVNHTLTSAPTVHVYEDAIVDGSPSHIKVDSDDYVLTVTSTKVDVEFAEKKTGRLQLIPSHASRVSTQKKTKVDAPVQLTANSVITIAIPTLIPVTEYNITLTITDLYSTNHHTVPLYPHNYDGTISLFNTPWKLSQLVSFDSACYRVFSANLYSTLSTSTPLSVLNITSLPNNSKILFSKSPYTDRSDTASFVANSSDMLMAPCVVSNSEISVDSTSLLLYHHEPTTIREI